jgi:Fanconi anemia group M protein
MRENFVEHSLIKSGKMQSRMYQESILGTAIGKNTLCVIPTGLGKTSIAILLAAHRLEKFPDSKIMILAPTKPLVNQHVKTFKEFIEIEEDEYQVLTGIVKPNQRKIFYKTKKIIFATPQTVQNDLEEKLVSLDNFSLLVIDEAHHAIGNYAYPYVVKKYLKQAENQRILALTASPGGTREKINEIYSNLGLEAVEIKTEEDEDVAPWVKQKEIEYVGVELPDSFIKIKQLLDEVYDGRIRTLKKMKYLGRRRATKRDLIALQIRLRSGIERGNKWAFIAASCVAQAIKVEHAIGLLETQGIHSIEKYWKKLRSDNSKAADKLINNRQVSNAMFLTHELSDRGSKHPKIGKLCSIVSQQVREKPDSKMIIFANFRDSVKEIANVLGSIEGVKPVILIGQKEGLSQKEQIDTIKRFDRHEYNVLVTTSIGEEGLHLSSADIAIFYEPVASEIRNIQRKGRVARIKIGRIIFLVTNGTRDEAYYWTALQKEKRMMKTLYGMKNGDLSSQKKLG